MSDDVRVEYGMEGRQKGRQEWKEFFTRTTLEEVLEIAKMSPRQLEVRFVKLTTTREIIE